MKFCTVKHTKPLYKTEETFEKKKILILISRRHQVIERKLPSCMTVK